MAAAAAAVVLLGRQEAGGWISAVSMAVGTTDRSIQIAISSLFKRSAKLHSLCNFVLASSHLTSTWGAREADS